MVIEAIIVLALLALAIVGLNIYRRDLAQTAVAAGEFGLRHYAQLLDERRGLVTDETLGKALAAATDPEDRRLLRHLLARVDKIGKVVDRSQGQLICIVDRLMGAAWVDTSQPIYGISRRDLERHRQANLPKSICSRP